MRFTSKNQKDRFGSFVLILNRILFSERGLNYSYFVIEKERKTKTENKKREEKAAEVDGEERRGIRTEREKKAKERGNS
jgi:hypothetical protein